MYMMAAVSRRKFTIHHVSKNKKKQKKTKKTPATRTYGHYP